MTDRLLTPFVEWPADLVLVLASRSPRRAELLAVAGLPHEVIPAGDVEAELAASLAAEAADPADYAVALAEAKARDVAAAHPDRLVLGADTVVILDGEIFEAKHGRPIILTADRQTTGGYPLLGTLASVSHARLAQCKPGDTLHFSCVDLLTAQRRLLAREHHFREWQTHMHNWWRNTDG